MEDLDALDYVDDLLDFSSDIGEDDEDKDKSMKAFPELNPKSSGPPSLGPLEMGDPSRQSSKLEEEGVEELEWLSNKDAFPAVVETLFVDMNSIQPGLTKHQRAGPMLEEHNTGGSRNINHKMNDNNINLLSGYDTLKVPVRARSKCRIRRRFPSKDSADNSAQQSHQSSGSAKATELMMAFSSIGRKCHHCGTDKTPQWRSGPNGQKTLCNACGVRFKSGRLVPEYCPLSSPSFRSGIHSNSHKKVMEIRKQKQQIGKAT